MEKSSFKSFQTNNKSIFIHKLAPFQEWEFIIKLGLFHEMNKQGLFKNVRPFYVKRDLFSTTLLKGIIANVIYCESWSGLISNHEYFKWIRINIFLTFLFNKILLSKDSVSLSSCHPLLFRNRNFFDKNENENEIEVQNNFTLFWHNRRFYHLSEFTFNRAQQ